MRRAFLLIGLVASWLLSACQIALPSWLLPWQTEPPASVTPAAGGTPVAVEPALQLLAWSGSEAEAGYFEQWLERFRQSDTGSAVTVTLAAEYETKLATALAANPPPDVVLLDSARVRTLAAAGALAPLDGALTAPDDLHPLVRAGFTHNGALYCAARDLRTLALIYNRERFDAAGLAYPTTDWNWDALRSAAEALTNQAQNQYGISLPPDFSRWLPFLYQAGGAVTDETWTTVTINNDAARTAMGYYVGLVRDGFAVPAAGLDSSWAGEAFAQGQAAMIIEGNWIVPYLAANAPALRYGIAELPAGPQGRATLAFASCYAVPANAPKLELARQLVGFLTAPDSLAAWAEVSNALPSLLTLLDRWRQSHPEQAAFYAGLGPARLWEFDPRFNSFFTTVNSGLQQAFLGVRSVDDILNEADGAANRSIAP
jgi:multiple sugar transport system substrate-binding protein